MTSFTKQVRSPRLIGRGAELQVLEQGLAQAARGQGQIILLQGEAGIGKTRLIDEIKRHAERSSFRIMQGNCFAPDRQLPYAPLLDLLRANYLTTSSPTGPALWPELYALFPELAAGSFTPLPDPDPAQQKKRLFHALVQFLIAPSAQVPLLIVFEDLHWSDETSLEFLLPFARAIPSHPIQLLLSYRTEETNPALDQLLAEFDRMRVATELTLSALDRVQLGEMIRSMFELQHAVREEFLNPLYALTEGNPLFVEEILQSLVASGQIYFADGQWERKPLPELSIPRSVQAAVHRRTEGLTEPAQQLLALAAVTGRRFDVRLLHALTDMNESELVLQLKQLMAAQLVIEESADQFAFRHALTREAIYSSLLRRERRDMHQRVAESLEQLFAASLDSIAADLAYHYHEAGAWAKSLVYAERAAAQAQQMYAPHEAIEQFSRALQAAEHVAAPLAPLLHARGQAYETIGDFERARADYEHALDAGQRVGELHAQWQALIDLGFLWASRDYARAGDFFNAALTLARAMQDPQTLAHTLNRIGNWNANQDQLQAALQYHQEALAIFQAAADRRGIAETLDLAGLTYEMMGDLAQGYHYLSEAVATYREVGDHKGLVSSLTELSSHGEFYVDSTLVTQPLPRARMTAMAEEARLLAQQIGLRSGEAYALCVLAGYDGYYGAYDSALGWAQAALALTEEIEHLQWNCFAHNIFGWLYRDLYAFADARRESEYALQLAHQMSSPIFVQCSSEALASTSLAQDDFAHAQAVLDAALGADPWSDLTITKRLCVVAWGELLLAQGDGAQALEIAERLIAGAPNTTPDNAVPRLWLLRGRALTQLKKFDQAEATLTAALASAHARELRPLHWRIHHALGKLYQRQDRRKEADASYSAARALVSELAAGINDLDRRQTYLHGTDALLPHPRTLTPRRAAKAHFGGLTARERQVATLIAAGNSNREIAERLVLSERTVAVHITGILNKLALSSRTQIAVWAVGVGLSDKI